MKIEKELIKVWKKRLKDLPLEKTAHSIGLPRVTLYRALNGTCSWNTMNKINQWLISKKDEEFKKSINQLTK